MTFTSPIPYSPPEEQVARSMVNNGFGIGAIAKKLRRSEVSIESLLLRLEKQDRQAKLLVRRCLCCGASFRSEGAHNRLCCRCRTRETTPFEL